jgi:hypoxanthine phosphoribosyltransferase
MRQLITPGQIEEAVSQLAERINRDYAGRPVVAVCVLKGSFIFFADLVRKLTMPVEVDFIKASSYGDGTVSSGNVRIIHDIGGDVRGREVLLVDDIVDTGHTIRAIKDHLLSKGPSSLKVCVMLDKPSRRVAECSFDYCGMEVEDRFLVGYGLDMAGRYRNLPGLYEIVEDSETS